MTKATLEALGAPATVRSTSLDTSRHRSFLSDVVIDYGPRDQLGQLFLAGDTATRSRGIVMTTASFDALAAVNRANHDSWLPLLPIFDPEYGGVNADNGLAIIARNANGEAVGALAARFYALGITTIREEIESLRLFYPDPERQRWPGEAMLVSAPSAATTAGDVTFTGAMWCRRDFRKDRLRKDLSAIVRGMAVTRWQSNFMFSFMVPENVSSGLAARSYFPFVEWSVQEINTPVARNTTLEAALVWTNMNGHLRQFSDYLADRSDSLIVESENASGRERSAV